MLLVYFTRIFARRNVPRRHSPLPLNVSTVTLHALNVSTRILALSAFPDSSSKTEDVLTLALMVKLRSTDFASPALIRTAPLVPLISTSA
jgi:hypothetical protein